MANKTIHVRSLPRPGFSAFFRGGHRWTEAGRTVTVTPALYDVLRAERHLAIDLDLEQHPEPEAGVLEYNDNRFDDKAWNESAKLREEHERLKKQKSVLEAQLEVDKLRAENAELEKQIAQQKKAERKADSDKSAK